MITFLNLYYMMNINFYVKSMGSFIILSVMRYEKLTRCYLLHTVGAFSGRIGLPPVVMGWAASCDGGP